MEIDQASAKRKVEYDSVNESLLVENIVGRVSRSYLQRIFSSYGLVECKFLEKKASGVCATVEFDQIEDAIRAIDAANENKIILNDKILKVTFNLSNKRKKRKLNDYLNDNTLIHKLNEDCIKKIFSYFTVDERLILDEVCSRWKDINNTCWSDIKTFSWSPEHETKIHLNNKTIDDYFKIVMEKCGRYLTSLDVSSISSSFMIPIRNNCFNLKTLKLKFDECNDKDFHRGFTKMKQLDTFNLESKNVQLKCITTLPKTIKNIYMFKDPTQPDSFKNRRSNDTHAFDKLCDITSLSLIGLELRVSVIASLIHKENLVNLDLSFCHLSNIPTNFLSQLKNLEKLDLHRSKGFIDDSMFTNISINCPKLNFLNINDCHIKLTTKSLDEISNLKNLQYLMINTIRNTLDGSSFGKMKKLKVLECICCVNINNNNIMSLLKNAPELERLVVIHTDITGQIINDIITIANYRKSDVVLKIILSSSTLTTYHIASQQIPNWLNIQEVDYYSHSDNNFFNDNDHHNEE